MGTVTKKVMHKLRKLIAMQEGAAEVGNVEEAQAFAAKVQELLLRHKLSMSDVELEEEEQVKVEAGYIRMGPERRRRVPWTEDLAIVVAEAFGCRVLVQVRSNLLNLIGRETDREVAWWMIKYLYLTLTKAENREYWKLYCRLEREHGGTGRGATDATYGFRHSFRRGFIQRLKERFQELRQAAEADVHCRALVVLDKAVIEYTKALTKGTVRDTPRQINSNGYEQGREHADRVDLNRRGVGGAGPKSLP